MSLLSTGQGNKSPLELNFLRQESLSGIVASR